jgi:hypothetical protein
MSGSALEYPKSLSVQGFEPKMSNYREMYLFFLLSLVSLLECDSPCFYFGWNVLPHIHRFLSFFYNALLQEECQAAFSRVIDGHK